MNCIHSFAVPRQSFWMMLLIILLVSAPLNASETSINSFSGKITGISVKQRVVEVDGNRYTLAQGAEIKNVSSQTRRIEKIPDLEVGQYIKFEFTGDIIKSLNVIDGEREPE